MRKDIDFQKRGFTQHINKLCAGFTLIELLVALGIFSVVILLGVSGFARALRSERQISAFSSVNNNMSLVLEQIAREIRTGVYFCANGITVCGSPSVLSFMNSKGEIVAYCLDSGAVERVVGSGSCGSGQKITSDNVVVEYLTFIISGNQDNDGRAPRITIVTGASPKNSSGASYTVRLQTTVSSRLAGG